MPRVTLDPDAAEVAAGRDRTAVARNSRRPQGPDDPAGGATHPSAGVDDLPALDPRPTFEEVATRYGSTIYSMAYRLTGNDEEARDLAQDVFVRVYRNLDKYEPGTFPGWLYRITKNLFLDRVRKRRRYRLEELPEHGGDLADSGPGPSDRLEQGTLRGDIEQGLLALPPTFRTAVVLCDVQGLTYEEIAAATGWPLGTVRSRIHRGRRLLRAALEQAGQEQASGQQEGGGPDG